MCCMIDYFLSITGPSCYCGSEYTLGEDLKTCVDVDECQNYGHCDQLCHNTKVNKDDSDNN